MAFQDGFGDIYMAGASRRLQEDTYNISHIALASLQQHTVNAMLDMGQ
jgi:ABC-type long-subunit fatty acid transport system fused permease/ATPase subunit